MATGQTSSPDLCSASEEGWGEENGCPRFFILTNALGNHVSSMVEGVWGLCYSLQMEEQKSYQVTGERAKLNWTTGWITFQGLLITATTLVAPQTTAAGDTPWHYPWLLCSALASWGSLKVVRDKAQTHLIRRMRRWENFVRWEEAGVWIEEFLDWDEGESHRRKEAGSLSIEMENVSLKIKPISGQNQICQLSVTLEAYCFPSVSA